MQEISMTGKELMVLASALGATTFYGLHNPFHGMSQADIRASIPELQHQAEKRGLATMGFDLSFHVKDEVADLISTCAMCDQYMTIEAIAVGVHRPKMVLYKRGDTNVLLQTGSELVVLTSSTGSAVRASLMDKYFPTLTGAIPNDKTVTLPLKLLRNCKGTENCNIEKLTEYGCSKEIADFILKGLQERCTYLSVIRVNLKNNDCDMMQCLISSNRSIQLQAENVEGEELCRISWLSPAALVEHMNKLFLEF